MKGDLLYLGHMLDTAREALQLWNGATRAEFDADRRLQLALTYLLQIVGEAARHVSPQFRSSHPQIPWNLIVAMRHRVVHDYSNVRLDIVWNTITQDLAPLVSYLETWLPPEPPPAAPPPQEP